MSNLKSLIDVAAGRRPADLVLKNLTVFAAPTGERFTADLAVAAGRIAGWGNYRGIAEFDAGGLTAVPGFIDSHVHVESTSLTPYAYERAVLPRGTTCAVCDPHELANVCGVRAFDYFLECASGMVMDLLVNLSSCVPASPLETSGADIGAAELERCRDRPGVLGLAEMMNFSGVVAGDADILAKLELFRGRVRDGHAPLLGGEALNAYLVPGILSDHECAELGEAREKLRRGMKILIREGSVARNLEALSPLLTEYQVSELGFCTDDREVLDILASGNIDHLVREAIRLGAAPEVAYRASAYSPSLFFGLDDRGAIAPGRRADLVLVSDFSRVSVERVMKDGRWVDRKCFERRPPEPSAHFAMDSVRLDPVTPELFAEAGREIGRLPVIGLVPGSLVTRRYPARMSGEEVALAAVLARHGRNRNVGMGRVAGFGLRGGAIAASVAHDSHNLVVAGDNHADMALAVNALIASGGGFAVAENGEVTAGVALPVGGLMTPDPPEKLARELAAVHRAASRVCRLSEPFRQLSFLPLSVIPHLKLTDLGLVDVDRCEILRPE